MLKRKRKRKLKPSFLEILNEQSKSEQLKLKRLKRYWKNRLAFIQSQILTYEEVILQLKKERKSKSNALQKRLFSEYKFLNYNQEWESLWDIFKHTPTNTPPSGAENVARQNFYNLLI